MLPAPRCLAQLQSPPAEPAAAPEVAPQAPKPADAELLLRTGQYDQAAEMFSILAEQPANRLSAHLGLAQSRFQVGEYEQAMQALLAVEEEAAMSSAPWHVHMADVYGTTGQYDKVTTHCQSAIQLDENHAGARRRLGEIYELTGRREEAIEAYRWFDQQLLKRAELPRDPAWITDAAVGLLRYSVLTRTHVPDRTRHALHNMLQAVYDQLDRTYYPARIVAAELLRERYNNDENDGSVSDYKAALKINAKLPAAYVGLGEVALEDWHFEEVEEAAGHALQINPRFAPAFHLMSKKLLLERRYDEARESSQKALAVNPNDVIAMSLAAAASACQRNDEDVRKWKERVAEVNPRCAVFHRMVGDALSGIRQYAASEREYRQAIEYDPTDVNARTELGMMYMQWGLEDKAQEALDEAWVLDSFNQRTKFTLELLDSLRKFARHETEHFIIRYDANRDPGLGEYIANDLEAIYDSVTSDFETTPEVKTIIEFFPTHRAFGVRITGKPWIHTVGACTGRVIALETPRQSVELMGHFDLFRVLKHEFTHTVTLAATDNLIPHWFTEGLAVMQEDAPRSFEWMMLMAEAVRRDRLFTLESINWGFIRPQRATDRTLAYAQSEWMCEYIAERFGYDALDRMIRHFREGETQNDVFKSRLGIAAQDFDCDFAVWARGQVQSWGFPLRPIEDAAELRKLAEDPDASADVLGRLAMAELDELDFERAIGAARRALELNPDHRDGLTALVTALQALLKEHMSEARRRELENESLQALERLLKVDPQGWTAPKLLAAFALDRGECDRAEAALTRLQRVCPMNPFSWRGLAGIYLQRGDDAAALPQLRELARMEQNDPEVPAGVARLVRRSGNAREAEYWYRQAISIAPFNVEYHRALGDLCLQLGDNANALREYRMLTLIEPGNAAHFESAALAAQKLGDKQAMISFAEQALKINPQSAVKNLLEN